MRELDRTSLHRRKSYHPYTEYKLTSGYNRKSKGDGDVFHRHGVYPTTTFSEINSQLPTDKRGSQPDRQNNLREEGANDKHSEGVPRGLPASVFIGM